MRNKNKSTKYFVHCSDTLSEIVLIEDICICDSTSKNSYSQNGGDSTSKL